jgi:sugar-specific transcriptional regulator TrmB
MLEEDKKKTLNMLERIGLNEKQSLTYLYLLESGGSSASKIAYDIHIARPTIYRILLDLSVKGLVYEIQKDNKKFFYVNSTRDLLRWKKDHMKLVNNQTEYAEKNLGILDTILNAGSGSIDVKYFNDIGGIHSIYEDHLRYRDYELTGFSHIESIERFLGEEFQRDYIARKTNQNITTRGIIPISTFSNTFADSFFRTKQERKGLSLRYADQEEYPLEFDAEIILYGTSKLSIINVNNETLSGIIIDNENLHKMFKSIFRMAWDNLE